MIRTAVFREPCQCCAGFGSIETSYGNGMTRGTFCRACDGTGSVETPYQVEAEEPAPLKLVVNH